MKTTFYAMMGAVLLLSGAISTGCQQSLASNSYQDTDKKWHVHTSSDGLMRVSFPDKPTVSRQKQDSPLGELDFELIQYEVNNKMAYTANAIKYPVDPSKFNAEAGLEGAISGQKTNGNEILEETKITKDELIGKEIMVKTKAGFVIRARFYIDGTGPTMYQVNVVGASRGDTESAAATKFLDSIEFVKKDE